MERSDRPAEPEEKKRLIEAGFVADTEMCLTWARSASGVSMTTEEALLLVDAEDKRRRADWLVALVAGGARTVGHAEALLHEIEGQRRPYSRCPKCGAVPLVDTEDALLCEPCDRWYSRRPLPGGADSAPESPATDFREEAMRIVAARLAGREGADLGVVTECCEKAPFDDIAREVARVQLALAAAYQRGQGSRPSAPAAIPLTAAQLRALAESDEAGDAPFVATASALREMVAAQLGWQVQMPVFDADGTRRAECWTVMVPAAGPAAVPGAILLGIGAAEIVERAAQALTPCAVCGTNVGENNHLTHCAAQPGTGVLAVVELETRLSEDRTYRVARAVALPAGAPERVTVAVFVLGSKLARAVEAVQRVEALCEAREVENIMVQGDVTVGVAAVRAALAGTAQAVAPKSPTHDYTDAEIEQAVRLLHAWHAYRRHAEEDCDCTRPCVIFLDGEVGAWPSEACGTGRTLAFALREALGLGGDTSKVPA